MPYGVMRSSAVSAVDHVSPLGDIEVTTPPSPRGAPSPTTVAVKDITAIERARLFVQGKQMELLQSLDNHQRITLSTWMYQYWLFAYKTAKHWGRGPQDWTADILHFVDYHQGTTISISSPNTPIARIDTPASALTRGNDEATDSTRQSPITMPSSLCRWSIHCPHVPYDPIPSPPHSPTEKFDLDDEESWQPWPHSHNSKGYTEKLVDSLESNDFSSIHVVDLPIAADHVSRAARHSPKELLEEALGFSIMSRNEDLMLDLIEKAKDEGADTSGLYPFHLAVTYLDGSRTCCSILEQLLKNYPLSIRKLYINDRGHTVLDQMMIVILKAHTSCLPSVVDVVFKKENRFEGEDVDVCGRWDADSDCVRQLLANGIATIPLEWKHMFCHTSIKSICDCIGRIDVLCGGYELFNTPSGLFLRHCVHCGLKLQLLPLHTLVLVGFHLSRSGFENENLFGILACLLCLLRYGANPFLKANISVKALLDDDQGDDCTHEELSPAELVEKLSSVLKMTWSKEIGTGWEIICNILRRSQAARNANLPEGCSTSSENEMSTDEPSCPHYPGSHLEVDRTLASLWAAVQTELLTYRRLKKGYEWTSPNFNMHTLKEGLIERGEVDIALLRNKMMKPFCKCGQFAGEIVLNSEDVSAYYFSNMDDWNRTTFIPPRKW
ncbi:hypothetical protein BDR22DRAFT_881333 [Usnea florida]